MEIRRLKTYSGATGYVYQYYFVGSRPLPAADLESPGTAYVFDVTTDRKHMFEVTVVLPEAALAAWQGTHARPLEHNEQYAAAKMRLFQGFDEAEDLIASPCRFSIDPLTLDSLLAPLDL
jgi:hypothetical protein